MRAESHKHQSVQRGSISRGITQLMDPEYMWVFRFISRVSRDANVVTSIVSEIDTSIHAPFDISNTHMSWGNNIRPGQVLRHRSLYADLASSIPQRLVFDPLSNDSLRGIDIAEPWVFAPHGRRRLVPLDCWPDAHLAFVLHPHNPNRIYCPSWVVFVTLECLAHYRPRRLVFPFAKRIPCTQLRGRS